VRIAEGPYESANVEHIEWVSALRLCLARPEDTQEIVLWQGHRLVVKTVSAADGHGTWRPVPGYEAIPGQGQDAPCSD